MMKKVNLKKLKLTSEDVLQRDKLSKVYGGMVGQGTFECYCGFVGGCGEDSPFTVNAANLTEALWAAGLVCQGSGATCQGL